MDSLISAIVEMAEGREMRLFHQTKTQDAQSIWKDGFQDIEVIEDDEKTLISQNTGIGELLKLMLLQHHQQHQQQLKKSGD